MRLIVLGADLDLYRIGAVVDRDKDRRTKKARVGGESVNTWAIEGGRLLG